jgi:hypothetical protein
MVNASAARQGRVLLLCAALLLTAAATISIAGKASWSPRFILSSSVLFLTSYWIRSAHPKASKVLVNFVMLVAVALSVIGVIGLLATRL